ncbi:MAG: hypothetical protein IJ251_06940 [Oscillospiraceae bacterium]|nr:hypothetical protein [Oscillospiraceae bacterium]
MPDNKKNIDDFELPPLPHLPRLDPIPPVGENGAAQSHETSHDAPLPKRPSLDEPLPKRPSIDEPLPKVEKEPVKDDDLPPVMEDDTPSASPVAAPMKRDDDEYVISEDTEPDPEPVLEDMTSAPKLAPMSSNRISSQKAMREKIRMSDLQYEMEAPKLDDLSDEYADPRTRAKNLADQDSLDREEKDALRRQVQEDLSRVPENFNARQSKKMYNKLMEEKQLKIAKKGFGISIIPILLGLAGAFICFSQLGWDPYVQIFQIIALFGAAGSLLLLIRSKQSRLFGMTMFAISLVAYVGLGLLFYLYQTSLGKVEYDFLHLLLGVVASGCNIGALMILIKNEAVNVYYSTKFSRKRDR